MVKKILLVLLSWLVLSGYGNQNLKADESRTTQSNQTAIEDVCAYFPKELVAKAVGKPIVLVELALGATKGCAYYTEFRNDYFNAPGGKRPGGRSIQIVLENQNAQKYKADKQKTGNTISTDPGIKMEHMIIKRAGGTIWQVALVLGPEKYIRIHQIQDAIDGPTLVKLGAKLAEKIQGQKSS